jgi:phosphoribosylamine--glycine ligase
MNILLVSKDLIAGHLAALMSQEGHNVKLFIQEKKSKKSFDNIVEKTENWKKELKWVGKTGLIVFDDIGYGAIQEKLRRRGYSVVGGSRRGDYIEENRQYGKEIFSYYGMKTVPLLNFDDTTDAINFIEKHRGAWVIKQNDKMPKCLNFVGQREDGEDMISVLKSYDENGYSGKIISLQKKIDGIEIGVGRYFNGNDWVGPLEMNIEHKKLFPGDVGPTTSEMGTLAWYDDNEKNKLFQETLAKLKPYLKEIDFRGDAEINCIVNEEGAFPLEATMRFGSPIIHLHSEIHQSPWGKFLRRWLMANPTI